MKTDRELLELAAKAVGIELKWGVEAAGEYPYYTLPRTGFYLVHHAWNPLLDDGDALRLAVKLRMSVDCDDYANMVMVYTAGGASSFDEAIEDNDPYAATRRAIVCAAAEIGRQMP